MAHGHALGLAITRTEITLLLIDASTRDVVARNRVALPAVDGTLIEHLDRLVESAPLPAQRVAVACTDPAVQILVNDRAHEVGAPAWLAQATIVSAVPALVAAVSSQYRGANPLVVTHLDHQGRPETTTPLMLIDPAFGTVIDTAQAPRGQLPAYERAGADALADAMAALPVVGLGVDTIVAAGAGAEIHGVIQEISRAAGLPVGEVGGRYSVAFGAALVAGREQPIPLRGRPPKTRPSHLAVAVVGLSAVLFAGGLAVAVAQHPDKGAPALSDSSLPVTASTTDPASRSPSSPTNTTTQASPPRRTSANTLTSIPTTTEIPTSAETPTTTRDSPAPDTSAPDTSTPDSTRRQNTPNLGGPATTTERDTSTAPAYTPPTRSVTPTTRTTPDAPTASPDQSSNGEAPLPEVAPTN